MNGILSVIFFEKLLLPIFRVFEKFCLSNSQNIVHYPGGNPIHVLFFYAKKYKKACLFAFVLAIAYELIEFGKFYLIQLIIDGIDKDNSSVSTNFSCISFLFICIFGVVSPIIWTLHSLIVEQSISSNIRCEVQKSLHKNLITKELSFFRECLSGHIAMRLHQVANSVRTGVTLLINQIPSGIVQFVGTAVMVGTINPLLTIPVVFWLVANIALVLWLIPRYAKSVQGIVSTTSCVSGQLSDIYNNILTVKMYGKEVEKDPVIINSFNAQAIEQGKLCRYNTAMSITIQMLNTWLLVIIVLIGLKYMSIGEISTGEFAAAIALVFRLASNVDWFTGVGQSVIEVYETLRDTKSLFSAPLGNIKNKRKIKSGDIRFNDVSFCYQKEELILNQINLTIHSGEKIGIIGKSGCGKSTLVNLITGLYRATNGTIFIDGKDIKTIDNDSLRTQIAVVTQDISLLNRSVKDNILYGTDVNQNISINCVLKQSCANDFICRLQDERGRKGLMSFVGEKGANLSGGQKQRIIIARALLKKTKIIILDEATSAVDVELEEKILKNILEVNCDSTIISITHDISTLKGFDRVFRLIDGRLELYSMKLD